MQSENEIFILTSKFEILKPMDKRSLIILLFLISMPLPAQNENKFKNCPFEI